MSIFNCEWLLLLTNIYYIRRLYKLVIDNKHISMPYRRLPNTDAARIRAMKTAFEIGQELPPYKLAFSAKLLIELRRLLPLFESSIRHYRYSVDFQNSKGKNYSETVRKARMYLTHFVKVMNMSVTRGDLSVEVRTFYGMKINDSTVPPLISEKELVNWGKKIIEGEESRIRQGGSPITNPTIAVVKVWYENFLHALHYNNMQTKRIYDITQKNNSLRKEVDNLIFELWNEVEKTHADNSEDVRKTMNEEYGLVYFYRKHELVKNLAS
jgi:hypothetical protein